MEDLTFAIGVWFLLGHMVGLLAADQFLRKDEEEVVYLDMDELEDFDEIIAGWSEFDHEWRNRQCAEQLTKSRIARGMSRAA